MLLKIYAMTMVVPAVRILFICITSILIIFIFIQCVLWIIKDACETELKIKKHIVVMTVLVFLLVIMPTRKEMTAIIILQQLDEYITDNDINIMSPGAVGSAAMNIEEAILRIENEMNDEMRRIK